MDYIFIEELDVPIRIGCTENERSVAQNVRFFIKISLPLVEAGRAGRLTSTVDYADVIQKVTALGQQKEFILLETLAFEVSELILKDDNARAVQVEASKQTLPGVKRTGVSIYREK